MVSTVTMVKYKYMDAEVSPVDSSFDSRVTLRVNKV
jgi:hypothetical protein